MSGQWAPTSSPQWGTPFARIRGLGRAAVILAVLWTGMLLLSAVTTRETTDIIDPDPMVLVNLAAGLLAFAAEVAAFVVGAIMLNTARRNAVAVAPDSQSRRAVWTWLGWVIPVVLLWFPFQVVRDIHRTTSRAARGNSGPAGLLGSWWMTWLLFLIAMQINTRLVLRDTSGSALMASEWTLAITAMLALPFWIRVVRDLVAVQAILANRASTGTETLLPMSAPAGDASAYPYGVPPAAGTSPSPYGAPSPTPYAAPSPSPSPDPFSTPSSNPGGEPSSPWRR